MTLIESYRLEEGEVVDRYPHFVDERATQRSAERPYLPLPRENVHEAFAARKRCTVRDN